jgi:poly(A) polymerase
VTARTLAESICAELRQHGYRALLVGGCVRDQLLGRPALDFDVATDAPPETLRALFPGADLVGAHFGVVLVRHEEAQVEVATFRSDEAYSDGRRPDRVRFQRDPREDALRRDFTINGLFLDPATGEVLDYTGGLADLRAGRIRAIGDPAARFAEDHLRLLRAVRFAARLGFTIEEETAQAIRRQAILVRKVAAERVRDELTRILVEGGARRGFELLDELGLLAEVLPEIAAMKGVAQPPEFHPEGDVWTHTLLMLELLSQPSPTLAWGVLLNDAGKPVTFRVAERIRFDGHVEAGMEIARAIARRLRFSAADTEQVIALVAHHLRFKDAPRMNPSTLKRFLRLPRFEEHLELHRLDCLASHRRLDNYFWVKDRLEQMPAEVLKPQPLVRGSDLIALGFTPSPRFGQALRMLEEEQLDGRISGREEALAFVRSILERAN